MFTPNRMNILLQKMKRRSETECEEQYCSAATVPQQMESPRKPRWMRKLSGCSPGKLLQAPPSSPAAPVISHKPTDERTGTSTCSSTIGFVPRKALTLPANQSLMPMERSTSDPTERWTPSKRDFEAIPKRGRFVKMMVAAFEEKCTNKESLTLEELKKTRKSNPDISLSRKTSIVPVLPFDQTYVIERRAASLESIIEPLESLASLSHDDDTLELSDSPSSVINDVSIFDYSSGEDETKPPEKFTKKIPPTPPVRTDSTLRREKAPKIVGAFLKKPVEIEDTEIDWIPFMGKKLPRKSSFKRLISMLTGNKITEKVEKLYYSYSKVEKRNGTPDSGFNDKESISSSQTSLTSVPEVLLHQRNTTDEPVKISMSTFRADEPEKRVDLMSVKKKETDDIVHSDIYDFQSAKLLLEEVPRSDIRVSLGPFFPLPPPKVIKSLGRKKSTRLNNDEYQSNYPKIAVHSVSVSPLPKHPNVDNQRNDDINNDNDDDDCYSIKSFDEFDAVELRRKECSPTWTFPSSEIVYDVPKSYFSSSEPSLVESTTEQRPRSTYEPITYDVPKIHYPPRPKSSIYDDAQSLKRRTQSMESYPQYYAFSPLQEKEFATVKPRNCRILPSNDLLRSMNHHHTETNYSSTITDRFTGDRVTEF